MSKSRAPTDIDKAVGKYIRARRLAMGMTLAELGHELGISHQQLQKYETGTNRLSAGMMWDIAICLKVSVDDLFDEVTSASKRRIPDETQKERDRIMSIINRIDSKMVLVQVRNVVLAFLKPSE